MCEAGALSLWACGKPIVAAWQHIELSDLPDIIKMHQACKIQTKKDYAESISAKCFYG